MLPLAGCMKSTSVVYSDKNVTVTLKDTVNFINVHASHGYFEMTVFGEKYSEVRGWIPFYIEIPEKESILFVTGREYDNGQATIHVVNLNTKKELHFPAYDSNIGKCIRNTNNLDASNNVLFFEQVEKVAGNKLIIGAGEWNSRYRYYLDLQIPEFEKEEGWWTNYPNTYVLPNGKKSNDSRL